MMKRFPLYFLGLFALPLFLAAGIRSSLALQDSNGQAAIWVYAVLGKEIVAKNESFNVQLRVENKATLEERDKSINAMDVSLEFPGDMLDLQNISDGGSIINLWVEKPLEVAGKKCLTGIVNCSIIKMSGLIPGGFIGDGLLANLTFMAKKEGTANLFFNQYDSKIFLNRLDAKLANVAYEPLEIKIAGESREGDKKLILDYFPPESFNILLSKINAAFNNKWFISFVAQDKGSGIDHYEVREKFLGLSGDWEAEESPYVLAHQSLFSIIEVKAVDKTGLERIEKIIPARIVYLILSIILGAVFLAIVLILKRFFRA